MGKPAGEQRDRVLPRIAYVQAQTNPSDAARLVAEQMSPGEIQNEAAISGLNQWAQQDALAALDWADTFPPGRVARARHQGSAEYQREQLGS